MSQDRNKQLMVKALREIKNLKAKLARIEYEQHEPIAIVGMACRFPGGANTPESYWQLLEQGVDAISEVPKERWDIEAYHDTNVEAPGKICSRYGGFIDNIAQFDAPFFGISPREAKSLDPHQRLLLEVSWQALENAHIIPEDLFQSNTGVFVGVSSMDNMLIRAGSTGLHHMVDSYYGTGTALAPIAGRLSYTLGLTGPSHIVDTACSSSLLALHQACESLRLKECDMALGGGVHLIFHPGFSLAFTKARMLSEDGRCKTFDNEANGYVRGEGCGVLVLKRLSDAKKAGDKILALIRGSATNQDGPSGGLTVPSGPSQESVVRQALKRGRIDPGDVTYIEAHGTGTPLGDPIEIGALNKVFNRHRSQKSPLWVGSAKTNIGHLEASAGVAGVMKIILALQHKTIPKHLHFKNPNELIPWDEIPIRIPSSQQPWITPDNRPRTAGINAFGFSGTNVHLVLSQFEEQDPPEQQKREPIPYPLLTLSAKTLKALQALSQSYADYIQQNNHLNLSDLAYSIATGRSHFDYRMTLLATDKQRTIENLIAFATGSQPKTVYTSDALTTTPPKVAFLFTGQGAQYPQMGAELYQKSEVFREILDQCEKIFKSQFNQSLLDIIFSDTDQSQLNQTIYTQPALFALEVALVHLWRSWGITPHGVMGHSVGEYAAAYTAGLFTLEEGLTLISARARLMQSLPSGGAMAAIATDADTIEGMIEAEPKLAIAAINGPENTVISGDEVRLDALIKQFKEQKIRCHKLDVSHAFHSPLMESILTEFHQEAERITFKKSTLELFSNLTGQSVGGQIITADYWVKHILHPVQFQKSLQAMVDAGCDLFIEIGPKPTLLGMGQQVMDHFKPQEEIQGWLPSLRQNQDSWYTILTALAKYHNLGGPFDKTILGSQRIHLPNYPFQYQHYWHDEILPMIHPDNQGGTQSLNHPLLDYTITLPQHHEVRFETQFSKENLPLLEDHRIFGHLVVAGAAHLSLILGAVFHHFKTSHCQLKNILFPSALVVPEEKTRTVQLAINTKDRTQAYPFTLTSFMAEEAPITHAVGEFIPKTESDLKPIDHHSIWQRCEEIIDPDKAYAVQAERHIVIGSSYRWLTEIRRGRHEAIGRLHVPEGLEHSMARYQLYPGLIDSCFALLVMIIEVQVEESFIPFSLEHLRLYRKPEKGEKLWAHALLRDTSTSEERLFGNIALYDDHHQIVAQLIGLEARKASREQVLKSLEQDKEWLHQLTWQPTTENNISTLKGRWLIFAQNEQQGEQIQRQFSTSEQQVVVALPNQSSGQVSQNTWHIHEDDQDGLKNLLSQPWDHVISLWALDHEIQQQTPEQIQKKITGFALLLIQTLLKQTTPPPLYLVTEQAQKATTKDLLQNPHQATLWGMVRSLFLEQPEFHCKIIDLDNQTESLNNLISIIQTAPEEENQLVWRQQHHVPRLKPYTSQPKTPFTIDSEGCYIISGGLGSLGRHLAIQLIQQGAGHLHLLSRREADEEINAWANDLMAQHEATIEIITADITQWDTLNDAYRQRTLPKIKGVFHLAGTLADGLIQDISWSQFFKPMQTKVLGTLNLHQLIQTYHQEENLDFVVHFSSITSMLGSSGQSNYSAANSFLDAWSLHNSHTPHISINWGPWRDIGMVARLSHAEQKRITNQGMDLIEPHGAHQLMVDLLGSETSNQVGIFSIDWPRFFKHNPPPSLLKHLVKTEDVAPDRVNQETQSQTLFITQLQEAPSDQQRTLLQKHLTQKLIQTLQIDNKTIINPRQRLFDLGVDSLISLELKNSLQKDLDMRLSSTLLFDYPTLEDLLNHLLDDLLPEKLKIVKDLSEDEQALQNSDEVNNLSDQAAEEALLAELAKLEIA
ncbi:type I polyketide synthase [Magnetococcales bacterium HHB-1]